MRYLLPTAHSIMAIEEDNYRTKTFVLDGKLEAAPGQFVMLWLPGFDEKPFSLVNADPITLMITSVGPFTQLLHRQMSVGDRLWIRGPFGVGYRLPRPGTRIGLVGGGYGVAPLYWLARQCAEQANSTVVLIGARFARDLLYLPRFHDLQTKISSTLEIVATTEDGSAGQAGRVTDVLDPLLHNHPAGLERVYACGPHGMLTAIESLCRQAGIEAQLSWEAYMRCGVGICGSCEHDQRLLCLDGPVLTVKAE